MGGRQQAAVRFAPLTEFQWRINGANALWLDLALAQCGSAIGRQSAPNGAAAHTAWAR